MKTAVVIATKNSANTIARCLSSLMPYYRQGYIGEIVVVDGHSTDGTPEVVGGFPARLLIGEGEGYPFTVACEMGWRNTKEEFVLFLDSDAYLAENFFPGVLQFFNNKEIGIVGAHERAIVTNRITRTIGEWWLYHAHNLGGLINNHPSRWSPLQRLYHRVAWGGEKNVTTSGPCYIVRRVCLEAVGGFDCSLGSPDISLSRKIIKKGWKATWWVDAPLRHHPASSFSQLVRQRLQFARADAAIQRDSQKGYQKAMTVISRLGTPIVGLILAIRFRNPLHLVLFPLAHYVWIAGYVVTAVRLRGRKGTR